ncbi:MAG TPA: serine hydrolase domain-containing protein [Candidatus Dormibacteraeota bacterium]
MEVRTDADRVLEQAVEAGAVAGVVAVAADDKGVVYEGAFGKRAAEGSAPMTLDTVFWIASMTKAITSVAALQQVEHGRLSLDEPIAGVLPELKDPQVLEGFEAKGKPKLRAAKRPLTLRMLLTHTAGFTYDIWNADMGRYMEHAKIPGIIACKNVTLGTPLVFEPGERWEYGINIDWAGKAVEKVSDRSLEDYFKAYIFGPLGMRDSGFVIGPDQRKRLATMHARMPDGALAPIEFEMDQAPEFFMGGGGLYATASDYLTFLRALLNKGSLDGVRILSPETVAEMNRNHIGDLNVTKLVSVIPGSSNDAEFFPGMVKKWGLAYMTSTEAASTGRSADSLAWAGLGNTYFWLDPSARLAGVFCTQILPFADPQALDLFAGWETAVYKKTETN